MKNYKIKQKKSDQKTKSQKIKNIVECFVQNDISFQDIIDEYTRIRKKAVWIFEGLEVDVKYEFNSDNKRLYAPKMVLASGSYK